MSTTRTQTAARPASRIGSQLDTVGRIWLGFAALSALGVLACLLLAWVTSRLDGGGPAAWAWLGWAVGSTVAALVSWSVGLVLRRLGEDPAP